MRPDPLDNLRKPFLIIWIEQQERARFQHDDALIARFLALKEEAWGREGLPFHLWFSSPALEILDVTFAMNLGWAKSRQECARLIIYQSIHNYAKAPTYHTTLVGEAFFDRIELLHPARGQEVQ